MKNQSLQIELDADRLVISIGIEELVSNVMEHKSFNGQKLVVGDRVLADGIASHIYFADLDLIFNHAAINACENNPDWLHEIDPWDEDLWYD